MKSIYSANLIFIFIVNILFFFSGICLNSLVIVSFWRSVQLRKKLCYFTIMVLSCCDLQAVLTNHPLMGLVAVLWLTEKINVHSGWLTIAHMFLNVANGSSLVALLVMSFDRYLATHYPIFHRTSVTKGKLLILFTFAVAIEITLTAISINNLIISYAVGLLIFCIISIPPTFFINYKLFTVARKSRRNNGISSKMKKSFLLKNISSCLLVVACLIVLSIPTLVYIGLRLISKEKQSALDNAHLAALWARTTATTISTFNCLIFYWKNKTLRAEGMKVVKSMKICPCFFYLRSYYWNNSNSNPSKRFGHCTDPLWRKIFNWSSDLWKLDIKVQFLRRILTDRILAAIILKHAYCFWIFLTL